MNDRDVDQLVRSALAAGAADAGSHPEPDTLFHYHAGELSGSDADAVQGHLALCPACAGAVLDFATFPHFDAPSDDDVPSDEEVEAGWADVQARLRASRPASLAGAARGDDSDEPALAPLASGPTPAPARGGVVVPMTPRTGTPLRAAPPPRRAPVALQAAAALLAVATVGLGGYAFKLQRSLTAPIANAGIVTLQSEDEQERGEIGRVFPVKRVARDAPAITFAVLLPSQAKSGPYTAELLHAEGEQHTMSPIPGLLDHDTRRVVFVLPCKELGDGKYYLRLLDAGGTRIAEFPFEIRFG